MCHCPWLWYLMMNLMSLNCFSPVGTVISLSVLSRLFLSLVSRGLIMICLGIGSFGLSRLGFTQLLESVGLCLFHIGKFLAITSLSAFQPYPAWPFVPRLWWHECYVFCYSPTGASGLAQSIFYLWLRLYSFYCSAFQLTGSSLCSLHYAIEPIRSVFLFQLLHFSVLKFPFDSSVYNLCLCWDFLYFLLFQGADWIASTSCQERSDGTEGRARLLSEASPILTGA